MSFKLPKTEIFFRSYQDHLKALSQCPGDLILVISDERVWELYGANIQIPGKKILSWVGPRGEDIKTFEHVEKCTHYFLGHNIHRKAHVLALGGGAVGDFAGFVASILLRGLSWSVLPTTLLSMVDASVGGKVAINSFHGKNLIGQFHFPIQISLDPIFLKTLPKKERISGLGEIFKYGFLDQEVRSLLFRSRPLEEIIPHCVSFKEKIVLSDPHEQGLRRILNLGHTLGHLFEVTQKIPHGVAVLWGIELVLKCLLPPQAKKKELQTAFYHWVESFDLKLTLGNPHKVLKALTREKIKQLLCKDKKGHGEGKISWVLLEDFNHPVVVDMDFDEVAKKLEL